MNIDVERIYNLIGLPTTLITKEDEKLAEEILKRHKYIRYAARELAKVLNVTVGI